MISIYGYTAVQQRVLRNFYYAHKLPMKLCPVSSNFPPSSVLRPSVLGLENELQSLARLLVIASGTLEPAIYADTTT
jgi:hypothetical protein